MQQVDIHIIDTTELDYDSNLVQDEPTVTGHMGLLWIQKSLEEERAMVTAEMARAVELDVPVKVNCTVGRNWMEVE